MNQPRKLMGLNVHAPMNFSRHLAFFCLACFAGFRSSAQFVLSDHGKPGCAIVQQAGASEAEKTAARQLSDALARMTGAEFGIVSTQTESLPGIVIGPGPLAAKFFPDVNLASLGSEDLVMRLEGGKLLLAGGRPRGTLYAVNRFLQEQCGVRWWTPWATDFPHTPTMILTNLVVRESPAFEYRAPFWFSAFDPEWKAHNEANDEHHVIPASLGGSIIYKGFAHTFYHLVPPEKYFPQHPEWFSEIKGKRTSDRAQLCLTNPKLRDFVVTRVKEWLRESPRAEIVSVTQNDWFNWCECENCKKLDDAQGTHAGTMIDFVNYVAEKIEPEFPKVAVDTFAYQYTRKPPRTLKTLPNVIVRLCSIECNFREPLDHASNAAFAADIQAWSKICPRLYIWDYVTDFRNYVHPHPNWFVLGPNLRLFHKYGVRGVFEEGAHGGYGAEMGEMRAWVLAQLMWNPSLDDKKLITEFLQGYYGKAAALPIQNYLNLMLDKSQGVYLGCFLSKKTTPYLNFTTLSRAEALWVEAEKAAKDDPDKLARVRVSHLPVQYAFLKYWDRLRQECEKQKAAWPLPASRKEMAAAFGQACRGVESKPWTHVTALSEHGETVDQFLARISKDSSS
jgi:hypothetical protein